MSQLTSSDGAQPAVHDMQGQEQQLPPKEPSTPGLATPQLPASGASLNSSARPPATPQSTAAPAAPETPQHTAHRAEFASLPIDVLEVICAPLRLQQRLLLTSCCRALWQRADVASSAALWGSVRVGEGWGAKKPQRQQREAALWQWLCRHSSGLRALTLEGGTRLPFPHQEQRKHKGKKPQTQKQQEPQPQQEQEQEQFPGPQSMPDASSSAPSAATPTPTPTPTLWRPLQQLTRLELHSVRLQGLDPELAALSRLEDLRLLGCSQLGGTADALAPLQYLGASLTRLEAFACGLRAKDGCLRPLSALTRLKELNLDGNSDLFAEPANNGNNAAAGGGGGGGNGGEAGEHLIESSSSGAPFPELQYLTALSTLSLRYCGLGRLPCQLSALSGCLLELELRDNPGLGHASSAEHAFAPLAALAALTRLGLGGCGLSRVPLEVSELPALRRLTLSDNAHLGQGGNGSFEGLRRATSLQSLSLDTCGLRGLPVQISCLQSLQDLSLKRNGSLERSPGGPAAAFAPLRHLEALTRLTLASCGLHAVPAELAELRHLAALELRNNFGLGGPGAGAASMVMLAHLPALAELDVSNCGLRASASPEEFEERHPGIHALAERGVAITANFF